MEALRRHIGVAVVKKAAPVPAATPAPPPESLYSPTGRVAFSIHVPADLSHLPNDAVRQAIRVQSAHTTLMTTHVALLRRLLRCVTALAMTQVRG